MHVKLFSNLMNAHLILIPTVWMSTKFWCQFYKSLDKNDIGDKNVGALQNKGCKQCWYLVHGIVVSHVNIECEVLTFYQACTWPISLDWNFTLRWFMCFCVLNFVTFWIHWQSTCISFSPVVAVHHMSIAWGTRFCSLPLLHQRTWSE